MIRKILLFFAIAATVSYAQQVRGIDLHSTAKDTIDARAQSAINDSLTALRATGLTDYDSVRAIVSDSLANATNYDSVRAIANDSLSAYFPVTNANLNGSITDSKLNQITTANKVAGSAVELDATGGLQDNSGLGIKTSGITWGMLNAAVKDSTRLSNADTVTFVNNPGGVTIEDAGTDSLEVVNGSIGASKIKNEAVASFPKRGVGVSTDAAVTWDATNHIVTLGATQYWMADGGNYFTTTDAETLASDYDALVLSLTDGSFTGVDEDKSTGATKAYLEVLAYTTAKDVEGTIVLGYRTGSAFVPMYPCLTPKGAIWNVPPANSVASSMLVNEAANAYQTRGISVTTLADPYWDKSTHKLYLNNYTQFYMTDGSYYTNADTVTFSNDYDVLVLSTSDGSFAAVDENKSGPTLGYFFVQPVTTDRNVKGMIVLGQRVGHNFIPNYNALKPNQYKPYQSGNIYFTVTIDTGFANLTDSLTTTQDTLHAYVDSCVLKLRPDYSPTGAPTPLVAICHGAGGGVTGSSWYFGGTSALDDLLYTNGYSTFDCNGGPRVENMGNRWAVEAYTKAWKYITDNYNVQKDIHIVGGSMGGLTAINFATKGIPGHVKSIGLLSGVTNIKGQAWDNPWLSTTKRYLSLAYDFDDKTGTTWDGDKVVGFNPYYYNIFQNAAGDTAQLIGAPIKIWHGNQDGTVTANWSRRLIQHVKNSGGYGEMRIINSSSHSLSVGSSYINAEYLIWIKRWE